MRMKKSIVLGAAGLVVLSACATDPSQYPGTDGDRTRQGAIAGAALGGVIGAITGDGNRGDDIVRGEAAELRNDFSNGDIEVIRSGDDLIVRMPNAILFATDSASLNPGLRSDLFVLAESLNKYPQSIVTVTGHTDNTGSAAYNQDLSERRAVSVSSVLRSGGVSSSRIRTVGAGESRPIATNQTAAGRQQNRRVDITITPTN